MATLSSSFSIDEILEIAERIERNGARFYRRAAEMESDADRCQVLLDLAEMEDEHEETFVRMRRELAASDAGGFDLDDQAGAYLRSFADGHVFDFTTDPAAWLTGRESLTQILDKAIGLEKDSVVFYLVLKDAAPEAWGKGDVDRIVAEEMDHIRVLAEEKRRVRGE